MKTLEEFLQWYVRIGGVVPNNLDSLREKFPKTPPCHNSSFKLRANEIKKKYNHNFKSVDFLRDMPDISKLEFEKK
jgi:hypothetical protein